jgi:hypothetical protein
MSLIACPVPLAARLDGLTCSASDSAHLRTANWLVINLRSPGFLLPRQARTPAARRCQRWLVDELSNRPEEFRVQVPAAHASQPASASGQSAGRLACQRVAAVFTTNCHGDYRDDPDHDPAEEDSDRDCNYDTGHDGLQYFRPAEFLPQIPIPAIQVRRGSPADLMFVVHGVPVCPRPARAVRYVPLRLTVLLSGAIWQILVHPSSWTARIVPMHPVIRAIPTFGIFSGCYHGSTGHKPVNPKYSSQSGGKDDLGSWDRPDHWMLGR